MRYQHLQHDASIILSSIILSGLLVSDKVPSDPSNYVAYAVSLALQVEAEILRQTRNRAPRMAEAWKEQERRRPFGGWDTEAQQDADDAHRRMERRSGRTPTIENERRVTKGDRLPPSAERRIATRRRPADDLALVRSRVLAGLPFRREADRDRRQSRVLDARD
jgi:hypothetical protein